MYALMPAKYMAAPRKLRHALAVHIFLLPFSTQQLRPRNKLPSVRMPSAGRLHRRSLALLSLPFHLKDLREWHQADRTRVVVPYIPLAQPGQLRDEVRDLGFLVRVRSRVSQAGQAEGVHAQKLAEKHLSSAPRERWGEGARL